MDQIKKKVDDMKIYPIEFEKEEASHIKIDSASYSRLFDTFSLQLEKAFLR